MVSHRDEKRQSELMMTVWILSKPRWQIGMMIR